MLDIFYNNKSIGINSGLLEILLRISALQVHEPPPAIGEKIRNDWLFISSGHHGEILSPDFDGYMKNDEGRSIALQAIGDAVRLLKDGPPLIDHNLINLLWQTERFSTPIVAEAVVAAGEKLLNFVSAES